MVMAATGGSRGGRQTLTRTSRGGHERTDARTDGGKQGEAGVVGAMDQSLAMQQAQRTLFDQLTVMQL